MFALHPPGVFAPLYTEADVDDARRAVCNTSIVLALVYWLALLPLVVVFRAPLNRLVFGFSGDQLVLVLAATMLIETFDALAGDRLQADGRPWALFWIRVGGALALRTAGVVALLCGMEVWGWILADAFGRLVSALMVVALAFPDARIRWNARLIRPLLHTGRCWFPPSCRSTR